MPATPSTDRRQHVRLGLGAAVTLRHEPTGREFPARCVDVSRGGMLLAAPATAPLQAGHCVTLKIRPAAAADLPLDLAAVLQSRPMPADIVRVDRTGLTRTGHILVGVRFR